MIMVHPGLNTNPNSQLHCTMIFYHSKYLSSGPVLKTFCITIASEFVHRNIMRVYCIIIRYVISFGDGPKGLFFYYIQNSTMTKKCYLHGTTTVNHTTNKP